MTPSTAGGPTLVVSTSFRKFSKEAAPSSTLVAPSLTSNVEREVHRAVPEQQPARLGRGLPHGGRDVAGHGGRRPHHHLVVQEEHQVRPSLDGEQPAAQRGHPAQRPGSPSGNRLASLRRTPHARPAGP